MTEDEFRYLCEQHDLTYRMSDDGSVVRKGQAERYQLTEASKQLPREVAVRIFNEVVNSKIIERCRSQFYW